MYPRGRATFTNGRSYGFYTNFAHGWFYNRLGVGMLSGQPSTI